MIKLVPIKNITPTMQNVVHIAEEFLAPPRDYDPRNSKEYVSFLFEDADANYALKALHRLSKTADMYIACPHTTEDCACRVVLRLVYWLSKQERLQAKQRKDPPILVDLSSSYDPVARCWLSPYRYVLDNAAAKGIKIWEYTPNRETTRIDAAYKVARQFMPLYLLIDKVYPNTLALLNFRILNKLPTYLVAPRYHTKGPIKTFEDLDPLKTGVYDEYLDTCYSEDQTHMLTEASSILHMMGHNTFPKVQVMQDVVERDADRYGVAVEYNLDQGAVKPTKAKPFYDSVSVNVPALALCYALCLWHAANSDPDAPLIAEAPPELVVDRYYDDSYAYA